MKPIVITDQSFEQEVVQSGQLTIVDFWAPWCGPCRMIAPLLEQLAEQFDGQVKITKINVDENPRTPQRFGIVSIPTLIFFQGGEIVDLLVGAVPKHQLEARIHRLLPTVTPIALNREDRGVLN